MSGRLFFQDYCILRCPSPSTREKPNYIYPSKLKSYCLIASVLPTAWVCPANLSHCHMVLSLGWFVSLFYQSPISDLLKAGSLSHLSLLILLSSYPRSWPRTHLNKSVLMEEQLPPFQNPILMIELTHLSAGTPPHNTPTILWMKLTYHSPDPTFQRLSVITF